MSTTEEENAEYHLQVHIFTALLEFMPVANFKQLLFARTGGFCRFECVCKTHFRKVEITTN